MTDLPDSGKKPLDIPQQDAGNTLHTALDLTANSKTPSPQRPVGELNLSMLLPVPQYHRTDKLKPIIEFLGEESGQKNHTLLGENLPIPKDSSPTVSNQKDSAASMVQDGIALSTLAKQNGISSSTGLRLTDSAANSKPGVDSDLRVLTKGQATLVAQSTQGNVASILGSTGQNNGKIKTVLDVPSSTTVALQRPSESSTNPTPTPPVSNSRPLQSITEGLVKSFLTSKFGHALGKSLLDSGQLDDSSYQNVLAQHFVSSIKPTPSPANNIPPNQDLIADLISGLINKPSEKDSTSHSASNKDNEKKTSQTVKHAQDSGVTNSSSPTISIGNKVFQLTDLTNALSLSHEKQVPNELKSIHTDLELKKTSREHPGKKRNKEKLRRLNEKISTLETLSDALDALTTKLDEKSEGDQKQEEIFPSSEKPNLIQEQQLKKHHTHHHKTHQLSEELDVLGALLARGETHTHVENKTPIVPQSDKNNIVGIKGEKALGSTDLEILQSKINQAIEMAEIKGRQHDSNQARLPLLVEGNVVQDVGAQTREEVATIHTNHVASKGLLPSKDSELQSLQDILTRLIDNAMRKGTLNQLVQRWDRSGSPFSDIAKNISLYLQGNNKLKMPGTTLGTKKTFSIQPTTDIGISSTVKTNLTSQLAKGIAGYNNFTSLTTNTLFAKAVNNILGALKKRQDQLHKSNSTNRSLFVQTDTLTNFKGIVLGGRINKKVPPADSVDGSAKMLGRHGNETFAANSSKPANFTVGNKGGDKIDNKLNLLRANHTLLKPLLGGQGKDKLTFSSYEAKNVSRTLRNNTLMDFMNSMEEPEVPKLIPKNNKTGNNLGDKNSKVKPRIGDLMTVIAASLLDLKDIDQDSSSKSKSKVKYEESGGIEKLLHGLPNDHKMTDFSNDDAVLEAPTDHGAKTNSSNQIIKRPNELHNSTESSTDNNTKDVVQNEKLKVTDEENQKVDLGDQTVTLTLETVDATPPPQTNESPYAQTGLRNNKVPHYLNVQSAVTLGKINVTDSKNIEHSFPQSQIQEVPAALSEFTAEAKKPEQTLPSDGDGKLTTISAFPEVNAAIGGDSQTKSTHPDLPLGLQMNAIGRIAETEDSSSVTPADLSAALTSTSDVTPVLASKSGETKSFEDKILPMASDLTSATDAKSGETESIVSKALPTTFENSNIIPKPSHISATPESEAKPTASEVREIATSIKALLKILSSYSTKLRLEDDAEDSPSGLLPTRSQTANRVAVNEQDMKGEDRMELPKTGLPATNNNDVYANLPQSSPTNFPPSSPTLPKYVDSGVFENIQEQPTTEANSYNWNLGPEHAHAQIPIDMTPTKTSLEPQLGAEQWSPGNEMARVTEELKDLNLPSIEDDPTVRAVQNIVAEENAFVSEKRKAIQKHKQALGVSSQLPGSPRRPGVFGRNTIPKHKGHHRNASHVEHKKNKTKLAYFGKSNDTRKSNMRNRNVIPGQNNTKLFHQHTTAVDNRKPAIQGNATHHSNKQSSSQGMMGNGGKKTQLVSSRDKIPGHSKNQSQTFNASVPVSIDTKKTVKPQHDLKKIPLSVHSNASSKGAVNTHKGQQHPGTKPFGGEKLHHGLNNTKVISDTRNFSKMKSGKTYQVMSKGNVTNNNGTVSKRKNARALKAISNIH